MFNNVGLDIFIGLVFIYLLYSLLATIVAEIIATQLGIRARNLREAIDRMLSDTGNTNNGDSLAIFWARLRDSLNLMKHPLNERINKFYNNPEIKYLGSTGIFKNPSSFKAETFSRTLLYELNGIGALNKSNIESELSTLALPVVENANPPNAGVSNNHARTLDMQSAQFVLSLLHHSNGDLVKFKLHLEAWFDRTMEQATEWYKRKIQFILMVLGFFMAWGFNAGTFTIINKLSTDKDARAKLVEMSSAYLQSHQNGVGTQKLPEQEKEAHRVAKMLQADVNSANHILGLGSWLPDKFTVTFDSLTNNKVYTPGIDEALLWDEPNLTSAKTKITYQPNGWYKLRAFLSLFTIHFWGYFVTALAISLGAPFWFDMLNKLMQLRTSIKQPTDSTATGNNVVSPLNRIG